MQPQEGGNVLSLLANPAPGSQLFGPFRRTSAAGRIYAVNAVDAGTASVPYATTIDATRIE
jgi:hypothetical protein